MLVHFEISYTLMEILIRYKDPSCKRYLGSHVFSGFLFFVGGWVDGFLSIVFLMIAFE